MVNLPVSRALTHPSLGPRKPNRPRHQLFSTLGQVIFSAHDQTYILQDSLVFIYYLVVAVDYLVAAVKLDYPTLLLMLAKLISDTLFCVFVQNLSHALLVMIPGNMHISILHERLIGFQYELGPTLWLQATSQVGYLARFASF